MIIKITGSLLKEDYNIKVVDINELVDQFAFGIKKHPFSIKNFLRYSRTHSQKPPKCFFDRTWYDI